MDTLLAVFKTLPLPSKNIDSCTLSHEKLSTFMGSIETKSSLIFPLHQLYRHAHNSTINLSLSISHNSLQPSTSWYQHVPFTIFMSCKAVIPTAISSQSFIFVAKSIEVPVPNLMKCFNSPWSDFRKTRVGQIDSKADMMS